MKVVEPCFHCPDRHPICHDSCPKYAEYKRQLKAQRICTTRRSGLAATISTKKDGWEEENGESAGCLRGIAGGVQGFPGIAKAMAEQWG